MMRVHAKQCNEYVVLNKNTCKLVTGGLWKGLLYVYIF